MITKVSKEFGKNPASAFISSNFHKALPCLQEYVYDFVLSDTRHQILTQSLGLAELSLRNALTSYDELQARAAYYTERSGACPKGTGAGRGT